jgi:hypothetical protein
MLVAQMLRFQLHIAFQKEVPGALQEVMRIIYCCNFLIMKSEEWFPFGSTEQFQDHDIVSTHVTDSANPLWDDNDHNQSQLQRDSFSIRTG